jgi:predicted HD phosphohydrolase
MTDIKVLEGGHDWQCASMEEREGTTNELHQLAILAITVHMSCSCTLRITIIS